MVLKCNSFGIQQMYTSKPTFLETFVVPLCLFLIVSVDYPKCIERYDNSEINIAIIITSQH